MQAELSRGLEVAAWLQTSGWIAALGHHRRAGNAEQREPVPCSHHTREREVAVAARLLEDRVLAADGWKPRFLDQLVGSEGRLEDSAEQLVGADGPASPRGASDHMAAEREQNRWKLRGRVSVSDAAAKGSSVADHAMGDQPHRVSQ